MRRALLTLTLGIQAALAAGGGTSAEPGIRWPSFRGPEASGIREGIELPETWNVPEGRNVRWKTPVPGLSHCSPVVWGDRVFIATAVRTAGPAELKVGLYGSIGAVPDEGEHEWRVLCYNLRDGKLLWERTACRGVPKSLRHPKATHANSTMATDGEQVVAFFGSEGLYCYDVRGRLQWKRDFGLLDAGYFAVPAAQWGTASSPLIAGDKVLVQCDVQKGSFLAALRLKDGTDAWRTPRGDVPTWSTPAVVRAGGRDQVVVNGFRHIGGYDLASGRELWRMKGGGDIPVPTPIHSQGLIFLTNAHGRMAPVYAIRPTASGDITLADGMTSNEHVAWSTARDGGYMQTPIAYNGRLYVCRDNGVLTCFNAGTGERLYQERLGATPAGFTASPVAGAGRVYFTGEQGEVHVLRDGPAFQRLGLNPLGETCLATPAIAGDVLLFRTRGHLVAVGAPSR